MFSFEIFENFNNTYFEEHLRTAAPERYRKIRPLLVNDTIEQQILFIEDVNLMKLFCAIFTLYQNVFCYFFQASKDGKSDNNNDFKISWATYCSRTILGIFTSSQLFLLLSNLFLYSWNNLFQKYSPQRHISPLERSFKNESPWAYFRGFAILYFNRYVDSPNL